MPRKSKYGLSMVRDGEPLGMLYDYFHRKPDDIHGLTFRNRFVLREQSEYLHTITLNVFCVLPS